MSTPPLKKPSLPPQLGPQRNLRALMTWIVFVLMTVYLIQTAVGSFQHMAEPMSYSDLYQLLQQREQPAITNAVLVENELRVTTQAGKRHLVNLPPDDATMLQLLRERVPQFDVRPTRTPLAGILLALFPWLFLFGIMWFFMRSAQGGGRLLSFGKSPPHLLTQHPLLTTS